MAAPRTLKAINEVTAKGAAGAVVVLAPGNDEIAGMAVGRSGPQREIAVDTPVPWSCAGKPLLAVAMMPLIASGELPMDTPVRHWLPEFGRLHPDLTARHLISHRSGIDDRRVPPDPNRPLHDLPPAAGSSPGETFLYSAWWNWSVLSAVLEAVSGRSVESVVRDTVLTPAGLRHSTFITPDRPGGADVIEFAPHASATDWLPLRLTGMGKREPVTRILGPLEDLARFYRWIAGIRRSGDGPLPAGLVREATAADRVMGFCVGMKKFGFGKHCSPASFGFGGAIGGSNVVVGLAEPEHDFCLAVAVNRLGQESAHALKAIVTAMYEDLPRGTAHARSIDFRAAADPRPTGLAAVDHGETLRPGRGS